MLFFISVHRFVSRITVKHFRLPPVLARLSTLIPISPSPAGRPDESPPAESCRYRSAGVRLSRLASKSYSSPLACQMQEGKAGASRKRWPISRMQWMLCPLKRRERISRISNLLRREFELLRRAMFARFPGSFLRTESYFTSIHK